MKRMIYKSAQALMEETKAVAKTPPPQQRGRDARTGRYIPVREAERRPSTTVVETQKSKKGK
jgi:hypothetical protein